MSADLAPEPELPGYAENDLRRRLPESPKTTAFALSDSEAAPQVRTPFARDRARVLHSAALRRLAGKTQVMGPGEGDVPRTRLTHSLEVAQIGRAIAEELGADADLVDTAGLAHDIGHPPFGHNGESALHALATECGGFEGNAQTLRILTRLEPKLADADGAGHGLNLTRACLDAVVKYPWPRRDEHRKFGAYPDDLGIFEWVREGATGGRGCVEAQVMDWADDVAYSVHDLEDGVHSGRISLRSLAIPEERAEIVRLVAERFWRDGPDETDLLESAATGLLRLPALAAVLDYDGSLRAQIGLKRLTSELVGRFTSVAAAATTAAFGPGPLTRYAAELVVPRQVAAEVALLKAVAVRYVLGDPQRLAMQERQRALLTELVTALADRAPEALDPALRGAWAAAADDRARWRVVLDQVASLTDAQAVNWHHQYVQNGAVDL